MYRVALSWPARRRSICTGGARVAAMLAADTAFSHVLGEGIAAAPRRPWSDDCGLHAISSPGCLNSTLSAADPDVRSVEGGRYSSASAGPRSDQESRSATVWPGLAFRWKAGMTPSP